MLRAFKVLRLATLGCLVVAPSCSSSSPHHATTTTSSLFVVPSSLDELSADTFFDHPFPSDVRRDADGTARFAGWPNPAQNALIRDYVAVADRLLDGFSPAAPIYLRFSGAIDPGSLPQDPPASTAKDASVQLIDVDPGSPEKGQRRLAQLHWQETVADGSYWQPNTLAILPMLGRPLRPKTRYAAVATSRLRAKDGSAIGRASDLDEALGTKPATSRTQKTKDLFAPALEVLAADGIAASDVVHLTVFTTNDPTAELFAIADDVKANVPAPTATAWSAKESTADYDVYEGSYGPSPNYQEGTAPYAHASDGGSFVFDAGKPKLQNTFDLRFALVVPNATKCPLPADGYPIALYAHGTGGNYRSFIDDATAQALAQRCVASTSIDQIFHGTRPGSPPADDPQRESRIELLFFNFDNVHAARANNRQSAVDVVQEARLFTTSKTKVPASVSHTTADIPFDASRVLFFGHSQGGLNGPLFLASSDAARGAVVMKLP